MGSKPERITTLDPKDIDSKWGKSFMKSVSYFNKCRVHIESRLPKEGATKEDIKKVGKKVEYIASLKDRKVFVHIVYGSKKEMLADGHLDRPADWDRQMEKMEGLEKHTTLVDAKMLADFKKANPDPKRIKQLKKDRADLVTSIKNVAEEIAKMKSYDYDKQHGLMYSPRLADAVKKKKLGAYFTFVAAIDDKDAPETIYTTYLKKGASKPVKLSRDLSDAIHEAYADGATIDFAPARKYVVKAINTKIVPKLVPIASAPIRKQIDTLRKEVEKIDKELK